jgi:DNA polymerase III gamma/tau subunit
MPLIIPNVPRCQHLKVNGIQCGSPALRRNRFCFFHKRFQEESISLSRDRARQGRGKFVLPVLENAEAVQVSLMQVMRLLASGQIDVRVGGLLLYALQTASFNLRHARFEPFTVQEVVIDRGNVDQTSIGDYQWREEDFPDPEMTEEEEAAAVAEEQAQAAAAARAAEQEKARRRAALEAEAERLMREGAAQRQREAEREAKREAARKANDALAEKNAAAAMTKTNKNAAVVGPAASGTNPVVAKPAASPEIASPGATPPALPPPRPPATVPRITAAQAARAVVNAWKPAPPVPAPTRRSGLKKGNRGRTNVDIDMDRVRQEVQGIARAFVMETVKHVSQRSPGRS